MAKTMKSVRSGTKAVKSSRMTHDRYALMAMIFDQRWPGVEREFRFAPLRKWRFDFCWPSESIALEVEGGVWVNGGHNRGSGFMKNIEKYNEAAILGWRLLRVTPQMMENGEVMVLLEKVLGR